VTSEVNIPKMQMASRFKSLADELPFFWLHNCH